MIHDRLPFFSPEDDDARDAIDAEEVELVASALRKLIRQVATLKLKELLKETREAAVSLLDDAEELEFDEHFKSFELGEDDVGDDYREAA